jgi:protein-tyrosine phosphatase
MRILFVCSGNACRSPVAEALLKKLNPEIIVHSAGTSAYYKIVEVAKAYSKLEGAEKYLKKVPQALETKKLDEYDLIVAMKPKHKEAILKSCPECADKIVVWNIDDPYDLPLKHAIKIFNEIRWKVTELANSV